MKAIITVGVSASGKSTFTKSLDNIWLVIERDRIRTHILVNEKHLCSSTDNIWAYWNFKWEKEVDAIVQSHLDYAVGAKLNVVFSDTNLNKDKRNALKLKLENLGYEVEIKVFGEDLNLDVLWKRDRFRKNSVGHHVIIDQYARFRSEFPLHQLKDVSDKPECIIFDIDGTLAEDMVNRKPYEWHKVGSDTYDEVLFISMIALHESGYEIILMSGRDSVCRKETEEWFCRGLINNGYNCGFKYQLFMRTENDQRKDSIIKTELFMNHVDGNYKVKAVFDDRPSVIRNVWHEFGFRTYSVGKNSVEF